MRAIVVTIFAISLSACVVCPEQKELTRLPGHSFVRPETTLEYFKAALLEGDGGDPRHEYLCFSEALKQEVYERRKQRFSFTNYLHARDEVRQKLETEFGPLARVEVGETRYFQQRPHIAEVELISGRDRFWVQMIQENVYSVWWQTPGDRSDGQIPWSMAAPKMSGNVLTLELAMDPPPLGSGDEVYRVDYERAWKIYWDPDGAMFKKLLEGLEEENPAPKSQAP